MSTTPPKKSTGARLFGALAALAVVTAIAWYARAQGHPDFASGVIGGGVAAVALVLVASTSKRRTSSVMRVVGGLADERERAILHRAMAHGAIAMFTVAAAFAVFLPESTALVSTGFVLWAGLIALTVSFLAQGRRS